jgi:hypothetical protein
VKAQGGGDPKRIGGGLQRVYVVMVHHSSRLFSLSEKGAAFPEKRQR